MKLHLDHKTTLDVPTLQEASRAFRAWITANNFGASDLSRGSGRVTENGRTIARVSYNGRVWNPNGAEILFSTQSN